MELTNENNVLKEKIIYLEGKIKLFILEKIAQKSMETK